MMRSLWISAAAALALGGCSTPRPPRPPTVYFSPVSPAITGLIKRTPIGEVLSSEIGGVVYSERGQISTVQYMVSLDGAMVAELDGGHALDIAAGTVAPQSVGKPGNEVGVCLDTVLSKTRPKLPHYPRSACLIDQDKDGSFDGVRFAPYPQVFWLPKALPYVVFQSAPVVSDVTEAISREMTYSGASGGTLRLLYREYTGTGLARSAFTQEVSYQLDARGQAEVGFKGMRLQVISATNSRLTYRVLNAMD